MRSISTINSIGKLIANYYTIETLDHELSLRIDHLLSTVNEPFFSTVYENRTMILHFPWQYSIDCLWETDSMHARGYVFLKGDRCAVVGIGHVQFNIRVFRVTISAKKVLSSITWAICSQSLFVNSKTTAEMVIEFERRVENFERNK